MDKAQALQTSEKLRRVIEQEPYFFDNVSIPVTMSMGVAHLTEYVQRTGASVEQSNGFGFIKIADDRLYEAKGRGRNCVVG